MGNVGYVEFLQHYLYCEGYNWGKELILCHYGNVKPSQVFPKLMKATKQLPNSYLTAT